MCLGMDRKSIIKRGTLYHIETDEEQNSAYLGTVQMYFEMCRLIKRFMNMLTKLSLKTALIKSVRNLTGKCAGWYNFTKLITISVLLSNEKQSIHLLLI